MTSEIYVALSGVDWVNGKPIPASREVVLTPAQARFDLAQGRIHKKGDSAVPNVSISRVVENPKSSVSAKKA